MIGNMKMKPPLALESSNRPLFPQWSHHVYPQFLPGSHPNHQQNPQVVIQQQHHQHYHQQMIMAQQQQHHQHITNANNNYINVSASNTSPILQHNNHIMNNNHQHLHQQSNMNYGIISGGVGSQILNNDIQNATTFYQHQFMQQHQRTGSSDGNALISNTMSASLASNNGLAQHMKTRSNRLMKNNGLNNNFYRSSGIFYCTAICVCVFYLNLFRFCVLFNQLYCFLRFSYIYTLFFFIPVDPSTQLPPFSSS